MASSTAAETPDFGPGPDHLSLPTTNDPHRDRPPGAAATRPRLRIRDWVARRSSPRAHRRHHRRQAGDDGEDDAEGRDGDGDEKEPWWKIHLFRGMVRDVRKRAPYYGSDWVDAWNYRVVPATVYMFFAKSVCHSLPLPCHPP